MTQKQCLIELFRQNNNRLTLGEILKHPFGYEARARFTEMRRAGYRIVFERGKKPSDNLYTLTPPIQYDMDESGQYLFI